MNYRVSNYLKQKPTVRVELIFLLVTLISMLRTMIETSFGTMKGSYHMIDDEDNYFDAVIPEFILSIPRVIH